MVLLVRRRGSAVTNHQGRVSCGLCLDDLHATTGVANCSMCSAGTYSSTPGESVVLNQPLNADRKVVIRLPYMGACSTLCLSLYIYFNIDIYIMSLLYCRPHCNNISNLELVGNHLQYLQGCFPTLYMILCPFTLDLEPSICHEGSAVFGLYGRMT